MVAKVRYPDFVVLCIYADSHRAIDTCSRTANHAQRRCITALGATKNENRVVAIVCHHHFVLCRIYINPHGPVELCALACNCAQRLFVAAGCGAVKCKRGRLKSSALGRHILSRNLHTTETCILHQPPKISVVSYSNLVMLLIPEHSMRVSHAGLSASNVTDRRFQADGFTPVDDDGVLQLN